MKKRFEGVFKRFLQDPSPLRPAILGEDPSSVMAAAQELPLHEQVKTNGAAFTVMQELVENASRMISREEGARFNCGIKIEQDTIRLTVEVECNEHAEIVEAERYVERAITNRQGEFRDLSGVRNK